MDSDFKYGTDGLSYEEHTKRYGKKNDLDHDKRVSGELPRLDRGRKQKITDQGGRPKREPVHGTIYAYRRRKCRCRDCVDAHEQRIKDRRKPKASDMHGILSWAIGSKCDCALCMEAIAKMDAENKKRNASKK
jgi:hypothetical protein